MKEWENNYCDHNAYHRSCCCIKFGCKFYFLITILLVPHIAWHCWHTLTHCHYSGLLECGDHPSKEAFNCISRNTKHTFRFIIYTKAWNAGEVSPLQSDHDNVTTEQCCLLNNWFQCISIHRAILCVWRKQLKILSFSGCKSNILPDRCSVALLGNTFTTPIVLLTKQRGVN